MAIAQDPLSILLWNIGYAFCHQLPERSFFYSGFQMPVCARDMGTYLGFLIVFLFWYFLRRYNNGAKPDVVVMIFTIIGMLPFFFDGFASYLGIYSTNNEIRLFTGLLMGAAMGLVLLSVFPLVKVGRTEQCAVFTWKDLIPIYTFVSIVGILVGAFDLGGLMFYVLETLTIAGVIILLFMAILTALLFVLKGSRFQKVRSKTILFVYALIIEIGLISILWNLHNIVFAILE